MGGGVPEVLGALQANIGGWVYLLRFFRGGHIGTRSEAEEGPGAAEMLERGWCRGLGGKGWCWSVGDASWTGRRLVGEPEAVVAEFVMLLMDAVCGVEGG